MTAPMWSDRLAAAADVQKTSAVSAPAASAAEAVQDMLDIDVCSSDELKEGEYDRCGDAWA